MSRPWYGISSLTDREPFCEVGGKDLWYLQNERVDVEGSIEY